MAEKKRSRDERAKLRAHCMTALRMRGGSHLAQHRVGLARKDARFALEYNLARVCFQSYTSS